MNKVAILGVSCSGKTTLGEKLSKALNISQIDLDELFWLPNWRQRSKEEFIEKVEKEITNSSWIISGNYNSVQPRILEEADVIIWLDYSRRVIWGRAVRRTLSRMIFNKSCCNGNYESAKRQFLTKDSLFLWILKDYPIKKLRYQQMLNSGQYSHKKIVHLKSSDATTIFLNSLK